MTEVNKIVALFMPNKEILDRQNIRVITQIPFVITINLLLISSSLLLVFVEFFKKDYATLLFAIFTIAIYVSSTMLIKYKSPVTGAMIDTIGFLIVCVGMAFLWAIHQILFICMKEFFGLPD
ncbi:MAG TPA: hypothetical protein PLR39_10310 [Treponemataceae bacterium]|nr:hypothetical protein [Treponemataceae bacterium]